MKVQTSQETWLDIMSRYESDAEDYGTESYIAFCNLVRQIAASKYANVLFASRSHDILVVTLIGEWPARCKLPHISVESAGSEIVLKYWAGADRSRSDKPLREIRCPIAAAWRNLEFLTGELLEEAQNDDARKSAGVVGGA